MNTKLQRKNHKTKKIIIVLAMIFSIIMIGVFSYLLYLENQNNLNLMNFSLANYKKI